MRRHVDVQSADVVLVDRATLAALSGRSEHTIRARCPVAGRDEQGRPLYDAYVCEWVLSLIPTRRRRAVVDDHRSRYIILHGPEVCPQQAA